MSSSASWPVPQAMEQFVDADAPPDEELYAILGVNKNATVDEINASYRRLSRQFHPDKHSADPEQQRDALSIFNKIKQAHEVLTDEHKRAIYDTMGRKGLEVADGILVSRSRAPDEIREEYLRLVQEKNATRLMMQANHKGAISVRFNCTEVFDYLNYDDDDDEDDDEDDEEEDDDLVLPLIEVSLMQIGQSINLPVSPNATATFKGNLVTQNGRGNGNFISCYRKILSDKSWAECQLVVGNGPVVIVNGYRSFWQKNHVSGSLILPIQFTHQTIGLRPGFEFSFARNLSKNFIATVGLKGGIQAEINASISYNSENKHIATAQYSVSLKESYLSLSYARRFDNEFKMKVGTRIGTKGLNLEYGCETRVTTNAVVGASITISLPSGVNLKLRYVYLSQTFVFDFLLNDEVLPSAIFYGTVAPVILFSCLKKFVIDPYLEHERQQELEKMRTANSQHLKEKRRQAQSVINLWRETYARILGSETEAKGLVVLFALYGRALLVDQLSMTTSEDQLNLDPHVAVIDVKIPIQCHVRDSRLFLPAVSKADLPGFFDPCFGEDKKLLIRYSFRERVATLVVSDGEAVSLPDG